METKKASRIRTMLLLLASSSFVTFSAAMMCPHPEDIYPCMCNMGMPHTLYCGGPNITMSQVKNAIDGMVEKQAGFAMKLKNVHVGKLDANLFNRTMINDLHFDDCIIEGFVDTSSPQEDNPSPPLMIQTLNIHNSIHTDVEINLASYSGVHHLILSNNVINNLEIDWPMENFMGPMSINIVNNSIESVDGDCFAPLTGLQILDMSVNQLKTLGKELRPNDANMLLRINLSRNRISSISKYYFQNMPYLKYVSLSHNRIQVLAEKTWKLTWSQLSYINLEENPLSCGPEIKWIQDPQPETVRGTCSTPDDKKSKNLTEVIKENNPTESSYLSKMLETEEGKNFVQLRDDGFRYNEIRYLFPNNNKL